MCVFLLYVRLFEIFVVFFAGDMNDKGSRADRYHIAIVEQSPLSVVRQFVAEECAGEAGFASHGEYGEPASPPLDVDDAESAARMLMSLVSMAMSTSIPFEARPMMLSPRWRGDLVGIRTRFSYFFLFPYSLSYCVVN